MESVGFSCGKFECIQNFIQMTAIAFVKGGGGVWPSSSSSFIQTSHLPAFAKKMSPGSRKLITKVATYTHTQTILDYPCIILDLGRHNNYCNTTPLSIKEAVCVSVCTLTKPGNLYVWYIGKVGFIYTSLLCKWFQIVSLWAVC